MMKQKLIYSFIFSCFLIINGAAQNLNWVKSYPTDSVSQAIAKDVKSAYLSDATYICGYDYNTVINTGLQFTSGPILGYFMKVNDKGDTLWFKHVISNITGVGSAFTPMAGAVDTKDNFYVVGGYSMSGPGQSFFFENLTFSTGSAFIIKFDPTGKIIWSKNISTGYCNFDDIDIDMYGNIYIMGNTRLQQVFGTDTVRKPTVAAGSNYSRDFIVSYDSTGKVRWAKGYGEIDINATSGTTERGGFFSLAVDKTPAMNIFTCGLFHTSYTYQSQTLTSMATENAMLLKLDSLGRHIKNLVIVDSSGKSMLTSIDINESGSIAVAGAFTLSAIINGTVYNSGSGVSYYFSPFIVKLDTSLAYKWVHQGGGLGYTSFAAIDKDGRCGFYQAIGNTTGGITDFSYLEFLDSSGKLMFIKRASYHYVSSQFTLMYPMALAFSKYDPDRLYCLGHYKPRLTFDSTITVHCKDTMFAELVLVNIDVTPPDTCKPRLNIGADTLYCSNFSRTLDAGFTNSKYQWMYNGVFVDTTKTIVATKAGLYKVNVIKNGCLSGFSDSINLDQKSPPVKTNIGADTIGCNVDSVVLYSNNLTDKLMWNNKTADSVHSYAVKKTGFYWLKATNVCGSSTDTIHVEINVTPGFTLGADTTYCNAFTRVMQPAIKGSNYNFLWSTGQTVGTISLNSPGTYWCKVNNACGTVIDTVLVSQTSKPVVKLGQDIIACDTLAVLLDAAGVVGKLEWNGVVKDSLHVYTVTTAGNYWLKAYNVCGTSYDTIGVKFGKTPAVNFGNDTTVCNASQLILRAGAAGDKIRWNNSTTDTNQIYTVTSKGTYWVKLTNDCGNATDDIKVDFKTTPVVNLGKDTSICPTSSVLLKAGNNGNDIAWMGNSTLNTQNYTVNNAGTYWVKVSNTCGIDYDSITIAALSLPVVNLGPDVGVKPPFSKTLDAGNTGSRYKWSTTLAKDTMRFLTVNTAGLYWVDVTNSCGTVRDSIRIYINTTGIEDVNPLQAIKVYPNPANNELFIDFGQLGGINFKTRITDISGKTVKEIENQDNDMFGIEISTVASGMYFISFTSDENRVFTKKIIIER